MESNARQTVLFEHFRKALLPQDEKRKMFLRAEKFLKYFLQQKIPADLSAEITKSHLISFRKPNGYVL